MTHTEDHTPLPPPGARSRTARPRLTDAQQELADDIHARALALRAASEDGLSIREAVDLAAIQLGLEPPRDTTDGSQP